MATYGKIIFGKQFTNNKIMCYGNVDKFIV